jgi:acyl-CoA carboxylase subunit beta
MAKSHPEAPGSLAGARTCGRCNAVLDELRTCPACGQHAPLTAWERIDQLANRGTFREMDRHLWSGDPIDFADSVSYERRVAQAQADTHLLDAVVTGRARLLGVEVVLVVFDFRFLGGSMGSVVGEKVARAFDVSRREGRPAIVICASGGARIQEGMMALFQMARTALAAARLRERGVPLLTVLCDPTMGGVLASFASLGDVILAEPQARISFVGPRVHEQAIGDAASPGSAEFFLRHGQLDAIVERAMLRLVLGSLASMLRPAKPARERPPIPELVATHARVPVWETVELARHPDRPSGRALALAVFTDVFELRGDRQGEDDDSILAAIGRLQGRAVCVVAQDRNSGGGGRTRPTGYRKAQRAFTMAERFHLPLITLIDTPGAAADEEAEANGITVAIAESLARLARLRTPVLNVVVGEGGSGGALALSIGDRLLMLENAIFSVIGPEAASAILYHDAVHARELAGRLKLTATDLLALHLVDLIVPEQPAAHEAPDLIATVLRQTLIRELAPLAESSTQQLLRRREARMSHVREVRGRLHFFVRHPSSGPSQGRAR